MAEIKWKNDRIKEEQVMEAIKDSGGFVVTVAKRLGCTRNNIYLLAKKWPGIIEAIQEERKAQIEFAEKQLHDLIKEGNLTAIIFLLKTKGGYTEKHKIEHLISNELESFIEMLEARLDPETFEKVLDVAGSSNLLLEG